MIYLDNAATSFPKPAAVTEEMHRCMTQYAGNPGRGAHPLSLAAAEKVFECRRRIAELLDADEPEDVFFTMNATQSINMVLKGLLRRGDHVILSDMEHNAVFRPVYTMAQAGLIQYDCFRTMTGDPKRTPLRICANIAKLIRPNTRLLVLAHASNLCGASLPLEQIGAFCRRHGILLVVDGAQSVGHLPISMKRMNIDALCAPGHKGLMGPQGCGFVILRHGLMLQTLIEGGSGVNSLEGSMPELPPERYEAGTLPLPAIAGLSEGVRLVATEGIERISEHEKALFRRARELLRRIPDVTLYAPEYEGSILLFSLRGRPSEEVARLLGERGICVRGGYHCAPLAHKTLGTPEDGAVRASFGLYNRFGCVDALAAALKEIAAPKH